MLGRPTPKHDAIGQDRRDEPSIDVLAFLNVNDDWRLAMEDERLARHR